MTALRRVLWVERLFPIPEKMAARLLVFLQPPHDRDTVHFMVRKKTPNKSKSPRPMTRSLMFGVLGICCWLLGATGLLGGQDVNAAPDFSDVESFLRQSKLESRQVVTTQAKALLGQLNTLLAKDSTLLAAYKNAYANVHFEGTEKDRAKANAWENDNRAAFKTEAFMWALRAHVQYLVATLNKVLGEDENAIRLTRLWIDNFPRTEEKFALVAKSPLLKGGISGSVFLKANLRAGSPSTSNAAHKTSPLIDLLHGLSNWHQGDLTNLAELHRVNIIGYYRSQQDPQIFQEWQKNIGLEQEAAERSGLIVQKEAFALNRRAWLLWQMGKDYAAFHQPRKAVDVMVMALKESPRCSDYDTIVAEILEIIAETRNAAAANIVAPAPVVGPATPATAPATPAKTGP
jgi:tetratricopeptide (TPR) repeat protein